MARIKRIVADIDKGPYGSALMMTVHIHLSDGGLLVNQKMYHADDFKSHFDLIWSQIGFDFKQYAKEEKLDGSKPKGSDRQA